MGILIFMPMAGDVATCMSYTGIDPFTKEEVYVARHLRDRKLPRALMQFFKPENYFLVGEALLQAGRPDLIGSGCDCLIPAHPPREAIDARWQLACARSHTHAALSWPPAMELLTDHPTHATDYRTSSA
jgi:hypothetical protein